MYVYIETDTTMLSIKFLTIIIPTLWTTQHTSNLIISAAQLDGPIRYTDVAIRQNVQDLTSCTNLEAHSFKELVQKSNLFIDTSLFIKEALAIMNQLNVIVIPPYFGRSINLDMYKTFLQMPLDVDGNPIIDSRNDSIYTLFKYGEIELKGRRGKAKLQELLQISKCHDLCEKYQGKLPVIYVDFSKIDADNFTHMEQEIWNAIRKTYQSHAYLIKFLEQYPQESYALNQFKCILEGNETNVTLPETLVFLSEQLIKKFPNRKVVVLIDDEDVPINRLKSHYTITKREIGKLYNLMHAFLKNTFNNNPFLHHGLVTGTEHMTGGSTNYELLRARNIVPRYEPLCHYFGLTNNTLYLLADKFNVPVPPWKVDELMRSDPPKDWWYRGKTWRDEKQDVVYVEFGVVLKYLMNQYEKMKKSKKHSLE